MKKMTNLWSTLLILLTITACQKAEIGDNENSAAPSSQRGGQTSSPTYGGQATGVNANVFNTVNGTVTSTQYLFAYTGMLPTSGGALRKSEPASIEGVLTADLADASITGQNSSTSSQASATNLNLTIGGHTITATYLQARAIAACGPVLSGSSQIESLVVNGTTITVTGTPNQAVYLPNGGLIIINEQSTSKKGKSGVITVTALHVLLPNGSDIRVASARAEIKC